MSVRHAAHTGYVDLAFGILQRNWSIAGVVEVNRIINSRGNAFPQSDNAILILSGVGNFFSANCTVFAHFVNCNGCAVEGDIVSLVVDQNRIIFV